MSELTQKHFDQVVSGLATKDDLKQAVAPLATSEQVEELARMVSSGFEDIQNRLDVTEQVKAHERKFHQLEEALHIKL
jgi:hypothetical protein